MAWCKHRHKKDTLYVFGFKYIFEKSQVNESTVDVLFGGYLPGNYFLLCWYEHRNVLVIKIFFLIEIVFNFSI